MASYSVTRAKHATLSTTTADTVALSGTAEIVQVVNRSSTEPLYVVFGADAATPTSAVDNSLVVPPGQTLSVFYPGNAPVTVKVVGNSNPYSVQLVETSA